MGVEAKGKEKKEGKEREKTWESIGKGRKEHMRQKEKAEDEEKRTKGNERNNNNLNNLL